MMRTYAGHTTAAASNELFRTNLAKGQTGLSVAFDLPTQTGYDSDSPAGSRRGREGRRARARTSATCGASSTASRSAEMNTSMTINAVAPWLLAMYQVVAEEQDAEATPRRWQRGWPAPRRTTSSRSTSRGAPTSFPPDASMRLITDMIAYTVHTDPEVEPDERLQLPPAGGGGDADAGARLRPARPRSPCSTGQGRRARCRRTTSARWSADQLLRQRRRPLRRRDLQDAGVRAPVGRDHPRALRRHRREAAPLPLRRAGQLARPHRGSSPRTTCMRIVLEMLGGDAQQEAPEPAPCSCPRGTRRSACRAPGTSSGRCALQQILAFETRPARARRHLRRAHVVEAKRVDELSRAREPRSTGCRRWAERSRRSST